MFARTHSPSWKKAVPALKVTALQDVKHFFQIVPWGYIFMMKRLQILNINCRPDCVLMLSKTRRVVQYITVMQGQLA